MTVSRTSIWHDSRLEPRLRELWAEGHTTIHIASELSKIAGVRITKNSVISKRARLKIEQHRPSHPERPIALRGQAKKVVRKPVVPKVARDPYAGQGLNMRLTVKKAPPIPQSTVIDFGKKDLLELASSDCRYICSDGKFCADPVNGETSWCSHHASIVFWRPERRVTSASELARSLRRFFT